MPGVQQIILPAIFVPVEDNIKIYIVRSANLALLKTKLEIITDFSYMIKWPAYTKPFGLFYRLDKYFSRYFFHLYNSTSG